MIEGEKGRLLRSSNLYNSPFFAPLLTLYTAAAVIAVIVRWSKGRNLYNFNFN